MFLRLGCFFQFSSIFPRFLGLVLLLLLGGVQAQAWDKIFECNSGEVVIDRFVPTGLVFYQIVIRPPALVEQLKQKEAIFFYRVNDRREVVLPLGMLGPQSSALKLLGDYDAHRADGRLYEVYLLDDRLSFKAYRTQLKAGVYETGELMVELEFAGCIPFYE